ncbi:MAG TPA: sialidase family protein [Chitinophagaceae bacterium]|nr:sialidase family protein [Chitinophagaceae bacterium]
MKSLFLIAFASLIFLSACQDDGTDFTSTVIATGQMPNIVNDKSGNIHLVYGNGDSILYSYSNDHGKTFSTPLLVSVLPRLAASHTRGPQIAATANGLSVTTCNDLGDIFSFTMDQSGKWSQTARVNDMDTVAKENLMALAANGGNAFAIWLDLRDKYNKIFGAKSTDGGKTWSKNIMIYASPDTTVCECCKPSVAIKGNNIYVMFRNWLNGNRDMYLIESTDGGNTFGRAKKLGNGGWALNGCPMDGGSLVINKEGNPETVWRRQKKIFTCKSGEEEKEIGEGKSCTMETVNGKNVYAWTEDGEVVVLKPQGIKINLGKGHLPLLRAVNNEHVICIWENEKQVHKAILEL